MSHQTRLSHFQIQFAVCVVSTDRISCGRVFLPLGVTCVHGGLSVAIPTQPHHTQLGARRELAARAN